MQNPVRVGGFLIFSAYVIYLVSDVASLYTEAPIYFVSILGTILLFAGVSSILRRRVNTPKVARVLAIVAMIAALVLGNIVNSFPLDETSSLASFHRLVYLGTAQAVCLFIAGAIPLMVAGTKTVRVMTGILSIGVLAFGVIFYAAITDLYNGVITWEGYADRVLVGVLLADALVIPSLVFAINQPSVPTTEVSGVANPFGAQEDTRSRGPPLRPGPGPVRVQTCPRCRTPNEFTPGTRKICASCGFGAEGPA